MLCMYVCMYVCMHVCMYACMYVCSYVYTYALIYNSVSNSLHGFHSLSIATRICNLCSTYHIASILAYYSFRLQRAAGIKDIEIISCFLM